MARTNGPIQVWNRSDTTPTDLEGGYAGGDSTAAAVGTSLDQSSRALGTVDNLAVTASTLDYGQEATATISGYAPNKTIHVGIPKGMPEDTATQLALDANAAAASAANAADRAEVAEAAVFMTQDEGVSTLITDEVAGAQTRAALQAREPHALVTDYGAVGDGTTDDTAAIQAALDGAQSVAFTSGTYRISGPLTLASHTKVTLPPDVTLLVPTGYAGDVLRIGGTTGVATRGVEWHGGQVKEDGKSGGDLTPPGSWTLVHIIADSIGTTGNVVRGLTSWWAGTVLHFETIGTGWANGNKVDSLSAWYFHTLMKTTPGTISIPFDSNELSSVTGQCGTSTVNGIAPLYGRGWTFTNVSPWDFREESTGYLFDVAASARAINVIGGLLTSRKYRSLAPRGEVRVLDWSQLNPWDAPPLTYAAASLPVDATLATLPTMVRRNLSVVWSLPDSGTSGVVATISVPDRATKMSFSMLVAGLGATTGDAYFAAAFAKVSAGSNLSGPGNSATVAVPLATDDVVVSAPTPAVTVTPGELYSVRIYRISGSASDTYAGAVALSGITVTFT